MTPEAGFLTSLLVTVGLLVGAAVTGRKRIIRHHVKFVAGAVLSLGVAIYFALKVGERYDLEAAGWITPFHKALAKITTAMYLWPLITGPMVLSGKVGPRVHRIGAWLTLGLTVASTITGIIMLMRATPLY